MTGRTHDMAAFTALSMVLVTYHLPEMTLATGLTALVANMIGGIAPDIDQPTAPFWRNLPVSHVFGKVFGKLLGGHRFLSHSLLGLFLFGFCWHYLLVILQPSFPHLQMDIIWWAFMIGFVSHLVMDTLTQEGVPWLLPIPVKFGLPPIKAFRVKTGGFVERFIVFPGLLLITMAIFYLHYDMLKVILHSYIK
jgi:inner membrane protein